MTEMPGGSAEPVFYAIESCGDPAVPLHEKVSSVFEAGDFLRRMGVDPALADEVDEVATWTRPLGTLTLARPVEEAEGTRLEGRGAYHEDIPAAGSSATIYVKGIGSQLAFREDGGTFKGFPASPEMLFFADDLSTSETPRMVGTLPVSRALIEAVNAGCIFAHVAKREGWRSIREAIASGVTIPLNVLLFGELSANLRALREHVQTGDADETARRAAGWDGNDHVGSISLIVPGNSRLAGTAVENDTLYSNLASPTIARNIGRSLRTLFEAGFCYGHTGAHGQNVYTKGTVVQADSSDLVALGDYKGISVPLPSEDGRGECRQITAEEQRRALLFCQFDRNNLLTPLPVPLEGRLPWETILETSEAFWSALLDNIVDGRALKQVLHYLPLMLTEFNAAVAAILIDAQPAEGWERLAQQRLQTFAEYEAPFGVLRNFALKLQSDLPETNSLQWQLSEVTTSGRLRAKALQNFLLTGHDDALRSDAVLSRAIALLEAIEGISDISVRDKLLSTCAAAFGDKKIDELSKEPDLISLFDGRPYDVIRDLLQQNRINDAHFALETLILSSGFSDELSEDRTGELSKHKWIRLLLAPGADYEAIYHHARFELYITQLGRLASGENLGSFYGTKYTNQQDYAAFDVSAAMQAEGLPSVRSVIREILYGVIAQADANADLIYEINDWCGSYLREVLLTRLGDHSWLEQILIQNNINEYAFLVASEYPELVLAHTSFSAIGLAKNNPVQAERFLKDSLHYYRRYLTDRSSLAARPMAEWDDIAFASDPKRLAALARQYEALGLSLVANYYRDAAARVIDTI